MFSAPCTFGIRDRIPKFSLAISTLPKAKSFRIYSTALFRTGQNFL
jgi:hypothetical protein